MQATGTFEVKLTPQPPVPDVEPDPTRGRMAIDKRFQGDLNGTSQGEMLMGGDMSIGSAGYVAIERVNGTLHGKPGGFLLQHSASMHAGSFTLAIAVIPGSGTGELQGIDGAMSIEVAEGKHNYTFEYSLP